MRASVSVDNASLASTRETFIPPPSPPLADAPTAAGTGSTAPGVADALPAPAGAEAGSPRVTRIGLLAGVAAVVLVVAAAFAVARGGDDAPGGTGTATTTTVDLYGAAVTRGTVDRTTTTADPSLPAVTPGPSGRGVRIDHVEIVQGTYQVSYRTVGYDPELSEEPGTHHLHFFFDDTAAEHAGQQSATPGRWVLWDVPSPFTGYRVADRPNDADRICALVADHVHNVELGSGNCVPLPTL